MDWFEKTLAGIVGLWGIAVLIGLVTHRKPRQGEVPTGALHEGRATRE